MTTVKHLRIAAVILAVLLVGQIFAARDLVANRLPAPEHGRYHASWKDLARTLPQGVRLSSSIVVAKVAAIRPAPDLTRRILDPKTREIKEIDRVPQEIIELVVEQTAFGLPVEKVNLYHTGNSSPVARTYEVQPLDPKEPVDRTTPPGPSNDEATLWFLEDDPGYKLGERYVLFLHLKPGPIVSTRLGQFETQRVIAPEGRYLIMPGPGGAQDERLVSFTTRGMAPSVGSLTLPRLLELLKTMG